MTNRIETLKAMIAPIQKDVDYLNDVAVGKHAQPGRPYAEFDSLRQVQAIRDASEDVLREMKQQLIEAEADAAAGIRTWTLHIENPETRGFIVAHDPDKVIHKTLPAAQEAATQILRDRPDLTRVGIVRVKTHSLVHRVETEEEK